MATSLNISDILNGEIFNRVNRMGVELEGAWTKLVPGISIEHDGSVFRDERRTMNLQFPHIGELPIGPMQVAAMPRLVTKYYPHRVDKTCGMHVHMSFKNLLHYAWLMVPEYQETIIHYLTEWAKKENFPESHHIWDRLAGRNAYCRKNYWPDLQISNKSKNHNQDVDGNRYTIVNYVGRQNTIEIRVLPMMSSPDVAIRGIQQVINITNACLAKLATRKDRINGRIDLGSLGTYEEHIEEELPLSGPAQRRLRGQR